jgi:cell division protein ZapA
MSAETVVVKILGKDYQVACPPGQRNALIESASYLDQQMASIRKNGKVIGLERIAVMAALNISYELLQAGNQPDQAGANTEQAPADTLSSKQLKTLNTKLEDALHTFRQLEIS